MNHRMTPVVTILHSLPGRVRVSLTPACVRPDEVIEAVRGHAGIGQTRYTPVTRSLLVTYDMSRVSEEEIVLRVALSLSLENGHVPIRVVQARGHHEITGVASLAAVAVLAAGAMRLFAGNAQATRYMEGVGGAGTALAVAGHGWREVRSRGNFDPEVLSLGYLLAAFARGNFLVPSLVTWSLTFGRHLLQQPGAGIVVRPVKVSVDDGEPRYEIVVDQDANTAPQDGLLNSVQALLKYALTGSSRHGLLDGLRDVSKVHGEVLEGMGGMPNGIPLRFGSLSRRVSR